MNRTFLSGTLLLAAVSVSILPVWGDELKAEGPVIERDLRNVEARQDDRIPLPPFKILTGHKPVTQSRGWYNTDWTFAFKGAVRDVRKTVEAELLPQGYKIAWDDLNRFGRNLRSVKYKKEKDWIILYEKMRYVIPPKDSPYGVVGHDLDGWVSFQVQLKRPDEEIQRAKRELLERGLEQREEQRDQQPTRGTKPNRPNTAQK